MWVVPASGAIGVAVHLLLVWLFYYVFEWGYEGVMLACGLLFFARFLAIYVLIQLNERIRKFDDVHLCSLETVMNCGPMAKLAFAILFMMIPPFIALEAYLILASYMSTESLSAFFILRNVFIFLREIPFAYLWICTMLTGICVGNGRI